MGEAAFVQTSALTASQVLPLDYLPSSEIASTDKIIQFPLQTNLPKETFFEKAAQAFTPVIVLLILIQIFDGLLTGFGVSQFGLMAEGNPMVRALMHTVGLTPALLIAKFISCGIIIILAFQALNIVWLRLVLRAVAAVYLCFAILPWTFLIFGSSL